MNSLLSIHRSAVQLQQNLARLVLFCWIHSRFCISLTNMSPLRSRCSVSAALSSIREMKNLFYKSNLRLLRNRVEINKKKWQGFPAHIASGAFGFLHSGFTSRSLRAPWHAQSQRVTHKPPSAGRPRYFLSSNRCSSDVLEKQPRQREGYASPRPASIARSQSSRRTAACRGASGRRRGWPDLAATGRVKIYGCSCGGDRSGGVITLRCLSLSVYCIVLLNVFLFSI